MEMFNNKVSEERLGPLKKSNSLSHLRDVERFFLKVIKDYGLESSYDVMAQEMPFFKTISYTEYATTFIMHPLNLELRVNQMLDAYSDNLEDNNIKDWTSYFANNIKLKIANKYQDREDNFKNFRDVDNIVVLPGSNKLKETTCLNKLKSIKKEHDDNVYFKPHPITTYSFVGELMDIFGKETILPRDIDLYYFLEKSNKVYTTHISESAMYAASLSKIIEPIDVYDKIERGSFYHINKFLFEYRDTPKIWIDKTLSSYKSGIINPLIDDDWQNKIILYLDYISSKRNKYKNWYIDSKKK